MQRVLEGPGLIAGDARHRQGEQLHRPVRQRAVNLKVGAEARRLRLGAQGLPVWRHLAGRLQQLVQARTDLAEKIQ